MHLVALRSKRKDCQRLPHCGDNSEAELDWVCSRQDGIDGDLADLASVDRHGDLLTGREVRSGRIAGRPGVCVDLDAEVGQIDEPVNGDAAAPVKVSLLAVSGHVLRRHFHQQRQVGRVRDPMSIVGVDSLMMGSQQGDAGSRHLCTDGPPPGCSQSRPPAGRAEVADQNNRVRSASPW